VGNILALRIGYVHSPFIPLDRCAAIGIKHLEIVMADPTETTDDVLRLIEPHGLQVSSIHAPSPIHDDAVFDMIADYSDRAVRLGARSLFVSVHSGEMPLDEAYARLRRMGDISGERGVALAMETHPNLCQNADIARQTMEAVNHPWVGFNFDTANVYYYNHNVTAAGEVSKIAKYVKSVHVKDTDGGFESPHFPVVGQGVVDYSAVFAALAVVGFHGPYTLELEGDAASADGVDGLVANVAACREYLVGQGLI
jgi:L-ribulose-5-phosphate 3-epimerase